MLPPAPGLFSITTDWPHTSCRRLPTRRAVISVEPPGGDGTTMHTGFAGQSAARSAGHDNRRRFDGSRGQADKTAASQHGASSGCDRPVGSGRDVFCGVWGQAAIKSMLQHDEYWVEAVDRFP